MPEQSLRRRATEIINRIQGHAYGIVANQDLIDPIKSTDSRGAPLRAYSDKMVRDLEKLLAVVELMQSPQIELGKNEWFMELPFEFQNQFIARLKIALGYAKCLSGKSTCAIGELEDFLEFCHQVTFASSAAYLVRRRVLSRHT